MANNFTQMPIFLDTDTTLVGTTNWRGVLGGAQLNPGNLPFNIQQTSGPVSRQWGIRPVVLIVTQAVAATITVAGDIVISDPQTTGGGGQLLKISVPATAASGVLTPIAITVFPQPLWRDFIVTGLTATKTAIQLWYRA